MTRMAHCGEGRFFSAMLSCCHKQKKSFEISSRRQKRCHMFFDLSFIFAYVRTSGTHKGSSFQNTRQRASSCILCTRRAIQRPLCATCGLTHDFFTCASLDGYAQGSCGGRIRHLWPADGQLRVSSIQPHRQISCLQRSLAKRIELAIGIL